MDLIALSGPAGSGKTTIARYMKENYGFHVLSFAFRLKLTVCNIYDMTWEQVTSERETVDPRYGLTPRFIMQRLGTEVARYIYPETWIAALRRDMGDCDEVGKFVIDDLRFENEAAAVRLWGGVVAEVRRGGVEYDGGHSSEVGIEPDMKLENNSTIEVVASQLAHLHGLATTS